MTTANRQIKRHGEAREAAEAMVTALKADVKRLELEVADRDGQLRLKDTRIEALDRYLLNERYQRVQAQRGLVQWLKENGQWRTGNYDPDTDPEIMAGIKAGLFPPRHDPLLMKQVVTDTLASRLGGALG